MPFAILIFVVGFLLLRKLPRPLNIALLAIVVAPFALLVALIMAQGAQYQRAHAHRPHAVAEAHR